MELLQTLVEAGTWRREAAPIWSGGASLGEDEVKLLKLSDENYI